MRAWLRKLSRPRKRRGLDLPGPPLPPPPFLAGSALGRRAGQLAAYQGWVFAAVNAIASRAAGVPLRLLRREPGGPGPEVTRHPLLDLLARPNPIMTGRELRYTLITHLELTGMAFALVSDNPLGLPAELWPLSPADLVEIETGRHTGRPIEAFRFSDGQGAEVRYRPEEVLYFRHPSPTSLVYGASPIEAMAHAFDIDLAVRVYQKNFFKNSARPEVVLSTDSRLSEDEARRILTRWTQKHQGLAHVFEPTLLDGGLKATPLAFSAKDFEFLALAGWTQDNILAAYRVPAGKLGLVKDLNRANAFAVDVTFNAECIRPRLQLIEEVLGAFLLPRFGDELVLAHDNPVPTDRVQNHREMMDQLDRGVITINEARAGLGRPAVAWGDAPYHAETRRPPAAPDDAAGLARAAEAVYRRLEPRFAGWSAGRVKSELRRRPELWAGLRRAGLSPGQRARVRAVITDCLVRGQSLETMRQALRGAVKEDDK